MSADTNSAAAKKPNSFLTILAVLSFVGAVITFIPYKNIDDACMLGYKALCAFTPVSSLILIVAGIGFWLLRKKF